MGKRYLKNRLKRFLYLTGLARIWQSASWRTPIPPEIMPVYAQAVEVDYMEYSSDALAQAAYVTNGVYGNTGGTITTVGANTVHTFTADGTFTPVRTGTAKVEAWGAGGGGGSAKEETDVKNRLKEALNISEKFINKELEKIDKELK